MFYAGQIIYSIDQSKFLLIKSISSNFNTLYLDSTFSTVDNITYTNGAKFTTQYSIYDSTINFKAINTNIFGNTYLLSTFKIPMSTGMFANSDKLLSELYFPINTISTSNSSVTSMTIPKIYNLTTQTLTNSSFRNVSRTGSSDISFNSTTNIITSTTTILSVFNPNEYIKISGTLSNNGLYLIDNVSPSTYSIKISALYSLVDEVNKSANLLANNLYSTVDNLAIFNTSTTLIFTGTTSNNKTFLLNSASVNSIYFDSPSVTTEASGTYTIDSYSDFIKSFQNLQELCMDHTLLIPTDNIITDII
jgi:hypothetical protein